MLTNICIMGTVVVYLVIMLSIGIWCSKRNKTTDDFYLGGRKLGPWVTALSAEASDMSSWLLMGLPGVAYLTGLADASWTAIGLAIGTYINWLLVAKKIRRYSHKCGAATLPAFFSNRFRDDSKLLSVIAAIVILIFFIPYTASGFAACGKLFNSLFGTDYFVSMVVCAFVIIFYTMTGGFLAASTTDFVQGLVMSAALIIVLVYGVTSAGGIDAVAENARSLPGYLSLKNIYNPDTNSAETYGVLKSCSMIAWGLGYFGMPHVLLRFMAIEDTKKLTFSRRVAMVWVVISLFIAVAIGVIGLAMTKVGAMEALEDPERIIVVIAQLISRHNYAAAAAAGLIIAGILAATMSTADSQLLAASSSVSQNIIKEKLVPSLSEKSSMMIARITLVVIAIIGIFLARDPESSVFNIVSFAWAGFGAAFGPVVLFSLFWKRTTKWGALAGMVVGGAMVFIWKYLIAPIGGVFGIYELLPAFLAAAAAIVIVSLITPAPSKEILDEFEAVKAIKD